MALMNAKSKEQSFTAGFIRLYRQLPELWNVQSKDYHDRYKKKAGYETLLRKYREFYSDASIGDLKKKLNALRTNYRKELRKYLQNNKYVPSLWYFGELCFLDNIDGSRDLNSTENTSLLIRYIDRDDKCFNNNKNSTSDKHRSRALPENPKKNGYNEDQQAQNVRVRVFRQYRHEPVSPPPRSAAQHLAPSSEDHQARDEHYYWVMACAADLRNMDRTQQIYAKKAIAEILMEGQLGALSRESVRINNRLDDSILLKIGSPRSLDEADSLQNDQS
nr:uncharacterized protein LOC116775104 [Danaus plexippus plexippus]